VKKRRNTTERDSSLVSDELIANRNRDRKGQKEEVNVRGTIFLHSHKIHGGKKKEILERSRPKAKNTAARRHMVRVEETSGIQKRAPLRREGEKLVLLGE